MRVLVACEFSGVVREAFRKRGHDAWSCDLIPCTDGSLYHFQNDVRVIIPLGWDLLIAHPPCTCLTNAGVRWLYKGGMGTEPDLERWEEMKKSAEFFIALANAPIRRKCIENPIMHSYARSIVKILPTQTIQPWMFGHAETKATCLYLTDLPLLVSTNIIAPDYEKFPRRIQKRRSDGSAAQGRGSGFATITHRGGNGGGYDPRVHLESPGIKNGLTRGQRRSITYQGIADAMAEQWGNLESST